MADDDNAIAGFTMLAHGTFHTYELSIPIFIVIWLDVFDVSAAVLGTVIGLGYGLIGVGAVPSGILADRFGSRTLIVASVVGMAGGFFLLSLAPNVYVLALAIMLWGMAASIYHPAGLSLISRCATERGTVFAYHGVGGNVGTALGPLVAALLLVFLDWQWVVRLLALPAIPVVLFGSRISFDEAIEPSSTDGGNDSFDLRSVLSQSRLLFTAGFTLAFVVVLLYGTYYRGLLTFLPDMIADLPLFEPISLYGRTAEPAQYVYTGLLMVGILGQYTGGRVTDHVRTEYALLAALAALSALAFVFLPSSTLGVAPFLVVCALLGFTLYATAPIYQVVIAERADETVHGLSYGFTYLGMFGIGSAGAALAGALLTYFDAPVLLGVLGAIAAAAALLCVVLLRRA
ncbi:MFS transporter [Halomarina ordinaria]|uniref:MFS transporter n=1 Tax=Halomarina ordinaria TaxID=3033939 RepID=A0ABD5UCD9_9EURY|nr:MFS transporter [Halomarina sp. PSRA2]